MENKTLSDVFYNFENYLKEEIFCVRIGKISSFDGKTADVSLINHAGDIKGCPVAGVFGDMIEIPLKSGDYVIILFCDDNFFKWFNIFVDEKNDAQHEKSNAIVLCGINHLFSLKVKTSDLKFNADAIFEKNITAKNIATFEKATTFKDAVTLEKPVTFKDTASFEKAVTFKEAVTFEKAVTFKAKITAHDIDAHNIKATAVKTVAGVDLGTHIHPAIGSPPTPKP